MAATLVDPQTGLVRDGVRLDPDGTIRTVEATTYTYCQGVYLGACVELAERDGHPRWAERAATVLHAVITMAGPDGVIPGFDDGGDGGLFNGILARYLADTAVRRPSSPRSPPRSSWPAPTRPGRAVSTTRHPTGRRPGVRPRLAPTRPHPATGGSRSRPVGPAVGMDAPGSRRQNGQRRPRRRPLIRPDTGTPRTPPACSGAGGLATSCGGRPWSNCLLSLSPLRTGVATRYAQIVPVRARRCRLPASVPAARVRLCAVAAQTSPGAFAANWPDGRWASGPFLSSLLRPARHWDCARCCTAVRDVRDPSESFSVRWAGQ